MKATLTVVALVLLLPVTARAQDGRLNLAFLDRLAERASESQNVTIDPAMLGIATGFVPNSPQGAAAKQAMSELKGIYVRSFEFDNDNAYSLDDLNAIRKQLSAPGWVRVISSEEKRDRELVEIYFFQQDGKTGGIAIIAAEARELAVVNIVGPIDFTKLAALQGVLGIPRVPGVVPPPAPPAPPGTAPPNR
jgi:hypothetical protein